MIIKTMDASFVRKCFLAGANAIDAKKEVINDLNVFPVPDGDTGTNMTMTIMSAAKEVGAIAVPDMETLAKAISSGSLRVHADMGKIQQVLYNLIDNAIKFSHFDSKITIETISRNGKAYISIKDYGMGIPKDCVTKIWERFYKTDLSRGRDKRGTGLGLSIVKEIVEAHDENINVISTEGVGTEFIFTLTLT